MKPILTPADGGKQVNILGIPMLIRIHGRDTGGVVSVVESHDVPGGGPPPHIHQREGETFQLLEGQYESTLPGPTLVPHPPPPSSPSHLPPSTYALPAQ